MVGHPGVLFSDTRNDWEKRTHFYYLYLRATAMSTDIQGK